MAYKQTYIKQNKRSEIKQCYFCSNDIDIFEFKDVSLLKNFLTHQYKIASRKRTGNCSKHQHKVANAVKRARLAGLLPFTQHKI